MRRLAGLALVLGAIVVPPSARAQSSSGVEIRDDFYLPVPITVKVGDTVTWTHRGSHPHSVTSDEFTSTESGTCAAIIGGDGCLANGDQFTVTFTSAGIFDYHCQVHGSNMVGKVIVQSPTATTTTTTTSTTIANTSTSETTTSLSSEQPSITQASLPSLPGSTHVALPKSIVRAKHEDDSRLWALVAIAIAGTTTIAGIVLVRRGRVPFG